MTTSVNRITASVHHTDRTDHACFVLGGTLNISAGKVNKGGRSHTVDYHASASNSSALKSTLQCGHAQLSHSLKNQLDSSHIWGPSRRNCQDFPHQRQRSYKANGYCGPEPRQKEKWCRGERCCCDMWRAGCGRAVSAADRCTCHLNAAVRELRYNKLKPLNDRDVAHGAFTSRRTRGRREVSTSDSMFKSVGLSFCPDRDSSSAGIKILVFTVSIW